MNKMSGSQERVRQDPKFPTLRSTKNKKSTKQKLFCLGLILLAGQLFLMSEPSMDSENPFSSLLTETERSASPLLRRSTRNRSSPYSTPKMTGVLRTPVGSAQPPSTSNATPGSQSKGKTPGTELPNQTPSDPPPNPMDELKQLMFGLTQKMTKIEGDEGRIVKKMDKMKNELSTRVAAVESEVGT